jgi:glucose/arabinose dehydrogenase
MSPLTSLLSRLLSRITDGRDRPRSRRSETRPGLEALEDRCVPATLPTGFFESSVAAGLTGATAMELAPNGDLWVLEQTGAVKRFRPGSTTADVVGNLSGLGLDSTGERGVLGIAFDPNFAADKQVFIYYTSTSGTTHNRVARFTVDDSNPNDYFFLGTTTTTADHGSSGTPTQTVIFDIDPLSAATSHNGGAIHFGPDGKLYVAVGDNTDGTNSQSLGTLKGKMLRINADGSIPTDNPFFTTATGNDRAIWALGLRNPFTFAFQPGTGRLFINDVGLSSFEEIDDGAAGANYGWPSTEGFFDQASFPNFTEPFYAYSHGQGTFQGGAITGGAFYDPSTSQFPAQYAGHYFFADYVNGWINEINPGTRNVTRFASGISGPVDLLVANDGSLYYLARNQGQVVRVTFASNQAPIIVTGPSDVTVSAGADATFTVNANGTPPLGYQWQKLGGGIWNNLTDGAGVSGSTTATLTLTGVLAADAGQYRVVVTNSIGSTTSNAVMLTVNRAATQVALTTDPAGQANLGQPVTLIATLTGASGKVTFSERGSALGSVVLSGGTASLNLGPLPAGPHTFTVSFVPDDPTDFAPSSASASLTVLSTPALTGNAAYVDALYRAFLHRPANTSNPADGGAWVSALDSGALTPRAVARAVALSGEALGVLVDGLFQQILGRAADPTGRAIFVGFLAGGGTVEQAVSLLIASPEFAAAAPTGDAFVRALYLRVLGRGAGAAEVANAVGALPALGRAGLAAAFLTSPEFRTALVGRLYGIAPANAGSLAAVFPALLHRQSAPAPAEVAGWVGSGLGALDLEVAFASTPEFVAGA